MNRSLLVPKTELGFFLEKGDIAIKKQTISGAFNFKKKFGSKITGEKGEKKLIISKLCSCEKLAKKYIKIVPEQIPWLLSINY